MSPDDRERLAAMWRRRAATLERAAYELLHEGYGDVTEHLAAAAAAYRSAADTLEFGSPS